MFEDVKAARHKIFKVHLWQKHHYDRRHRWIDHQALEYVFLSATHLSFVGSTKFWQKFIGPFNISSRVYFMALKIITTRHLPAIPSGICVLLKEICATCFPYFTTTSCTICWEGEAICSWKTTSLQKETKIDIVHNIMVELWSKQKLVNRRNRTVVRS